MAFDVKGLAPMSETAFPTTGIGDGDADKIGGVPVLWGYITSDTKAAVEAANYFNEAASRLTAGSVIYVISGAQNAAFSTFFVSVKSVGKTQTADGVDVVDISNDLAIPA